MYIEKEAKKKEKRLILIVIRKRVLKKIQMLRNDLPFLEVLKLLVDLQ